MGLFWTYVLFPLTSYYFDKKTCWNLKSPSRNNCIFKKLHILPNFKFVERSQQILRWSFNEHEKLKKNSGK